MFTSIGALLAHHQPLATPIRKHVQSKSDKRYENT